MRPLYHTRVSTCNALGLLVEQTLVALRVERLDRVRHEAPPDERVAVVAGEVELRELRDGHRGRGERHYHLLWGRAGLALERQPFGPRPDAARDRGRPVVARRPRVQRLQLAAVLRRHDQRRRVGVRGRRHGHAHADRVARRHPSTI